jgi:hypothetical protein
VRKRIIKYRYYLEATKAYEIARRLFVRATEFASVIVAVVDGISPALSAAVIATIIIVALVAQ